uniref:Uncharacterized protein n=1 Tax=Daphnia galeata TaxID=27404 RepID=A0A8J2WVC7_9CRUS|nr:unnamed protein product [Daphnia galeata]
MSLDLPTGKLFQKKLLYVQHVDESKPLTTEIPISELKFNVLYNTLIENKELAELEAILVNDETSEFINQIDCHGYTFLEWADAFSREDILKRFAQDKTDMIDQQGLAPLHWATVVGSLQKIKLLLKKGANINAQTKDGHTALHLALRDELNMDDNEKIVKQLLNNDEAEYNKDAADITILHRAVMSDTLPQKLFQEIQKRFPDDVNAQDDEGDTPLMVALFHRSPAKVKELLPCSNVNIENKAGYIALHYAAMWPDIPVDLFNEIIDKSADINAQDNNGDTPLNWALLSKSVTAVQQLLIKGANVNLENKGNEMAIHFAVSWTTIPHDIIQKIVDKTEGNIDSALRLARGYKLTSTSRSHHQETNKTKSAVNNKNIPRPSHGRDEKLRGPDGEQKGIQNHNVIPVNSFY